MTVVDDVIADLWDGDLFQRIYMQMAVTSAKYGEVTPTDPCYRCGQETREFICGHCLVEDAKPKEIK